MYVINSSGLSRRDCPVSSCRCASISLAKVAFLQFSHPETSTRILLVEDNRIDARLTRHAIQKTIAWHVLLEVVEDGEKALELVQKVPKPDLVILDLNLPKLDGTEVLCAIRATDGLREIPVFVFSSCPADVARMRMQAAGVEANGYFEKPCEIGTYSSVALEIKQAYESHAFSRASATA